MQVSRFSSLVLVLVVATIALVSARPQDAPAAEAPAAEAPAADAAAADAPAPEAAAADSKPEDSEKPEPFNYEYKVEDKEAELYHGKEEKGEESGRVEGKYYVWLPDKRLMTVTYYVDGESGFVPTITFEDNASPIGSR